MSRVYSLTMLKKINEENRWENQPGEDMKFEDLDFTRILQVRNLAIQSGRLSPRTSTKIEDILDQFKLRREGKLTNAAKILLPSR